MAILFGWVMLITSSQPTLAIELDGPHAPDWLPHVAFALGVSLSDLKDLTVTPAGTPADSRLVLAYEGGSGIGRVHARLLTRDSDDAFFVTGNWERDTTKLSVSLSETVRQHVTARLQLNESRPPCSRPLQESVVFLVDGSGSMDEGEKIPAMRRLVDTMLASLSSASEASLLAYRGDGCPAYPLDVIVPFTQDKELIASGSQQILPHGGTPLSMALPAATRYLQRYASSENGRIVIISDGQNDCGDMEDAKTFIESAEFDVTIESVAIDVDVESPAFEEMTMIARAFGGDAITTAELAALRALAESTPQMSDFEFRWSTQGG